MYQVNNVKTLLLIKKKKRCFGITQTDAVRRSVMQHITQGVWAFTIWRLRWYQQHTKNTSTLTYIHRYFLRNATFESPCIFYHLPCTVTTREPSLTIPQVPPSFWQTWTAPTIKFCTMFQSSSFLRNERKLLQSPTFRRKCSWSAPTLKMEPTTPFETSANIHKSKWYHIPPDLYRISLLSCPWPWQLLWDVPANADCASRPYSWH